MESESKKTNQFLNQHQISIAIVVVAIVSVIMFICWEVTKKKKSTYELAQNPVIISNNSEQIVQANPEVGIRGDEPTTTDLYEQIGTQEVDTDHELNQLLAGLGIELEQVWDNSNLQAHTALENYLAEHPESPMVPPGTYEAYAIYEGSQEKDLAALQNAGYTVGGKIYPDGTYDATFLGFNYKMKYDQHHVYFDDNANDGISAWNEAPYVWDGEVLHIAVHAIDVYLVRTGDV